MTRETKVGLLAGLVVIVVFAMLLLHADQKRGSGDVLAMFTQQYGNSAGGQGATPAGTFDQDVAVDPTTGSDPDPQPSASGQSAREPGSGIAQTDPWSIRDVRPPQLDPTPEYGQYGSEEIEGVRRQLQDSGWELPIDEEAPVTIEDGAQDSGRVAPPTGREREPILSPYPNDQRNIEDDNPGNTREGVDESSPALDEGSQLEPQPLGKDYVVQKGDSLRKITKRFYGSADSKIVNFLARVNSSRIRDKDLVIAGQTLFIPTALPIDLTDMGTELRGRSSAEEQVLRRERGSIRPEDRRRPTNTTEDLLPLGTTTQDEARGADGSQDGPGPSGTQAGPSWYTIQAGDTMMSISRKQLGSARYWKQILKMNPKVNPKRLMPGEKIKLPAKPETDRSSSASQLALLRPSA